MGGEVQAAAALSADSTVRRGSYQLIHLGSHQLARVAASAVRQQPGAGWCFSPTEMELAPQRSVLVKRCRVAVLGRWLVAGPVLAGRLDIDPRKPGRASAVQASLVPQAHHRRPVQAALKLSLAGLRRRQLRRGRFDIRDTAIAELDRALLDVDAAGAPAIPIGIGNLRGPVHTRRPAARLRGLRGAKVRAGASHAT